MDALGCGRAKRTFTVYVALLMYRLSLKVEFTCAVQCYLSPYYRVAEHLQCNR